MAEPHTEKGAGGYTTGTPAARSTGVTTPSYLPPPDA